MPSLKLINMQKISCVVLIFFMLSQPYSIFVNSTIGTRTKGCKAGNYICFIGPQMVLYTKEQTLTDFHGVETIKELYWCYIKLPQSAPVCKTNFSPAGVERTYDTKVHEHTSNVFDKASKKNCILSLFYQLVQLFVDRLAYPQGLLS